jgi:hypothetical protein
MLVLLYQDTRHHIPEEVNLHTHHCENLKSSFVTFITAMDIVHSSCENLIAPGGSCLKLIEYEIEAVTCSNKQWRTTNHRAAYRGRGLTFVALQLFVSLYKA